MKPILFTGKWKRMPTACNLFTIAAKTQLIRKSRRAAEKRFQIPIDPGAIRKPKL